MSTIRECCHHIKAFNEMIKNMRRMNKDDGLLMETSQILDEATIAELDKEANEYSALSKIITISDEQLSYELEDDYRESLGLPIHVDYPLSISEDEEYIPLCNESEEKKDEVIRNLWPGIIENDYTVLSFRDNMESMLYQFEELISLYNSNVLIEEYKDRVMEIGTDSSIKK